MQEISDFSSQISKETFEKEIEMCKSLNQKGSCKWGECYHCGVIPLLVKLYEGRLIEDWTEINQYKTDIFREE